QDRRSDRSGRRIVSRALADRRGARSLRCVCRASQARFFQDRGINRRSVSNEQLVRVAPSHRTGWAGESTGARLPPTILYRRACSGLLTSIGETICCSSSKRRILAVPRRGGYL